MGYSRAEATLFSYLKTKSTNCERKLPTVQRVPKYFSLYVGKDGYHTPYNGRIAFVYLLAGPGSFRMKDWEQFEPFVKGADGLMPKSG
jgi:hypothetical protein